MFDLRRLSRSWRTALVLLGIGVTWQVIAEMELLNPFLFPPPTEVFRATVVSLTDPPYPTGEGLGFHIAKSAYRAAAGWAIGVVLGVIFGVAVEWWKRPGAPLAAILEFVRPIPAILGLPVLVIVFGLGDIPRVIVIAWVCFIFVAINTIFGVRDAKNSLLPDVVRSFGGGSKAILGKAVLGLSLPQVLAGMRQAVGLAVIMMVASELILATDGLGWFILYMRRTLFAAEMYGAIVLVGILGLLFGGLFRLLERAWLAPYLR